MTIIEGITKAYTNYANYVWGSITDPFRPGNFLFYFLIVSLVVWALEIILPWRKEQKVFRKQFWQDAFYVLFNLILFNLIVFAALSSTTAKLFNEMMSTLGSPGKDVLDLSGMPQWSQFLIYFLLYDFIQWAIHNALHRVPWLWRFHRVHHSAEQMSFIAHFRFHFMEIVFYRIGLYVILAYLMNFKLEYAFYMYAGATLIGHLNHANLGWDYGPLKYLLNSPKMHIWHHAKDLPESHPKGMNFGLSLSVWDYLFKTNYVPSDGKNISLGFPGIERYPKTIWNQLMKPFFKKE